MPGGLSVPGAWKILSSQPHVQSLFAESPVPADLLARYLALARKKIDGWFRDLQVLGALLQGQNLIFDLQHILIIR